MHSNISCFTLCLLELFELFNFHRLCDTCSVLCGKLFQWKTPVTLKYNNDYYESLHYCKLT